MKTTAPNFTPAKGRFLHVPIRFITAFMLAATLLSAEAASSARRKTESPRELTQAERWKAMGGLQVFTTQRWKVLNDETHHVYATYQLYDANGRYLGKILNVGPMNEPEKVRLDPGNYVVVARAFNPAAVQVPVTRGEVRIPVTVSPGKVTVPHLDKPDNGSKPKKK
jgi:hypothetical protein